MTNCASGQCNGGVCTLCATNYVLSGGQCVLQCSINNCTTCNNQSQCTQCATGLNVSTDGYSCVSCTVNNCMSCQTNNVCTACAAGFIVSSLYGCITCNVDNCNTCSANNICSVCASGYTNVNNACVLCGSPCATCNANGGCATCLPPYNLVNGSCVVCNVPNCQICASENASICSTCLPQYTANSNQTACVYNCPANCLSCTGSTCSNCANNYYYNSTSNACMLCGNTPQCIICNPAAPNQCNNCTAGFYVNSNSTCSACPDYCASCSSSGFCNALTAQYSSGYVLVMTGSTNTLAYCDPNCNTCSNINPMICVTCSSGFYLSTTLPGVCVPCALTSNCM